MGELMGEARFCRLYSPAREKYVRPLPVIGPESATDDWPSVSLVTAFPLAAVAAVKPESAASVALGRQSSRTSPWNWLPPLLVIMLTTLPVLAPYSAENAFVSTVISCTTVAGILLKIV